jgi:hypothetical protein
MEQKKKQNSKRKKKITKCEGPINKSTKDIQIFLEFSDIEKGLARYQNKTEIKIHGKGIKVCFAEHISKQQFGLVGPEAHTQPTLLLLIFLLGWI